jgi:hypothetical protein
MSSQTTICAKRVCANAGRMNDLKLETSTAGAAGRTAAQLLTLKHTNDDAFGAVLVFRKDPATATQPGDTDGVGSITFVAKDQSANDIEYSSIVSGVVEATNLQESGSLTLNVATAGSATAGLILTGPDGSTSSVVDATIGSGATSILTFAGVLRGGTDALDNPIQQSDGTEIARIHQGDVVPTAAGTSTSLSAGTGFGLRHRVLTLGSGNDDNTLTLTAADSGSIIFITPTNAVAITLPLVGTETGMFFKLVIADKINKALTVSTTGTDGNDKFYMRCQTLADDGATMDIAGDTLTLTNMLEGSWINLTCVAGAAAEIWLAEVFSNDTVASTNG